MKSTALCLALLLGLVCSLLPGCTRNPPPPAKKLSLKGPEAKADQLTPALDLLRQATEAVQYNDVVNLVNAHLSRETGEHVTPLAATEKESLRQLYQLDNDEMVEVDALPFRPVPLSAAKRQALQKLYGLDNEEMAEVDATFFRPLDAYHLQSCCLFRDAGRGLEVGDAPPLEQVQVCFDWVMRRVQLHEQGDEGLPAAFVLRRGFGSALDRALVFLALLRQFQIEGCILAPPGRPAEASGPLLAGVLVAENKAPALALFDPALGRAIPGPGNKGIATLRQARADPGLLSASAIAPGMAAKLEAYQVGPLEALSPRMRYLQHRLFFQDKLVLFQNALAVGRELSTAAGREALVWTPAARSPSATRAMRLFLSPEEGGIDKSGRYQRFKSREIPWAGIQQQLQEMRLYHASEIPQQARDMLLGISGELFTRFSVQPKELFLHGQFSAALKRADRIRTVLETEEAAKPLEDAVLQKRLKDWRARVKEAYISALVRMEAAGQAKVAALWNEDQYLNNVRDVDREDVPLQKFEKKLLSLILLNACREALGQQVNYLVASCVHEKAAALQANLESRARAGKDIAVLKEKAGYAWLNARGAWNRFLGRYQLSPQALPRRLADIRERWQRGDREGAVNLWEQLHLDMHATFDARLRLAEAQSQLQATSAAAKDLLADLDKFQRSDVAKHLNDCLENARNTPWLGRLQLLARDWDSPGNIQWLRETARSRLEETR